MSIREAGADDAARLHEVAAATFRLACPPGTLEADMAEFIGRHLSVERMREYLADPARRLFLAEVKADVGREAETEAEAIAEREPEAGGTVAIGYTMLVAGEPTDPDVVAALRVRPTAELSKCYVLADRQGSGAASALLEATVDAARTDGAAAVWLGVNQLNARANAFYEKHGFQRVGVKKFLVGEELHDDFVRERLLS